MKRIAYLLLLLPAAASAQKGYQIKGTIAGLKDSTEIRLTHPQTNAVLATARSSKGNFELSGEIPEPMLTSLTIGSASPIYLYVESSVIRLSSNSTVTVKEKDKTGKQTSIGKTGKPEKQGTVKSETVQPNLSELKVEGSQSQVDFIQFQQIFTPLLNGINQYASAANTSASPDQRAGYIRSFDSVKNLMNAEIDRFITAKKNSYVSPFVLGYTASIFENPVQLNERFQKLDPAIRNSNVGKSLEAYIQSNLVGAIGSDATDFTQNDTTGKPVTLSSLRGKYVLLDFWASWCRPCRMENPNVVKAYQRFSNKNFTILGISLDQQKEAWVKAIQADKLSWTQVSDLQHWSNAVAQLYHVTGIPQNFLVDPTGKIVAKNLRGADLEAKLCELLGCN
jgi:peroxiredoxin